MNVYYFIAIYLAVVTLYLLKRLLDYYLPNKGESEWVKQQINALSTAHQDQLIKQSQAISQIKQNFQQVISMQDEFQKSLIVTQTKMMNNMNKALSQKTNSFHNSISSHHSTDSARP